MNETDYAPIGIGGKQLAYWWLLESIIVSLKALEYGTEPLPEIEIARN